MTCLVENRHRGVRQKEGATQKEDHAATRPPPSPEHGLTSKCMERKGKNAWKWKGFHCTVHRVHLKKPNLSRSRGLGNIVCRDHYFGCIACLPKTDRGNLFSTLYCDAFVPLCLGCGTTINVWLGEKTSPSCCGGGKCGFPTLKLKRRNKNAALTPPSGSLTFSSNKIQAKILSFLHFLCQIHLSPHDISLFP